MEPRDFVIFDIETTGLSIENDDIIEVGAVILKDREIVGSFQRFVGIDGGVPDKITKLTGIDDRMIKGSPKIEDVLKEFKGFVGDYPLVAHNASFDWGFICEKGNLSGIEFKNKVYDSLKIARKLIPGISKHDLGTLCRCFGIDNEGHHRADNDARVLSEVFIILLEAIKRRGISINDVS